MAVGVGGWSFSVAFRSIPYAIGGAPAPPSYSWTVLFRQKVLGAGLRRSPASILGAKQLNGSNLVILLILGVGKINAEGILRVSDTRNTKGAPHFIFEVGIKHATRDHNRAERCFFCALRVRIPATC
jgi:hypothetical protein